jgi:hypothetical protein
MNHIIDQSIEYINLFCLSLADIPAIDPDDTRFIFRCRSRFMVDMYLAKHPHEKVYACRFEKWDGKWAFHSKEKIR